LSNKPSIAELLNIRLGPAFGLVEQVLTFRDSHES